MKTKVLYFLLILKTEVFINFANIKLNIDLSLMSRFHVKRL